MCVLILPVAQAPSRTSGLVAPIMLLTGHSGEVFGVKFSPDGTVLASCSHDKHLFLWNVYGECENYMVLKGAEGFAASDHCLELVADTVSLYRPQECCSRCALDQ